MRRFIKQKAISYALIISLIGGLLMPVLVSAFESETRVLLCTSQGYQWVTIYDEQASILNASEATPEHCVYCLTSSDEPELALFSYSYFDLEQLPYRSSLGLLHNELSHLLVSIAHPRAPPFLI